MDLSKVIHLFESKHTSNLSDRHAAGIIQLCKEMVNEDQKKGFYYRDLPQVAKVFDLSFQGIQNGKYELIPAVLQLLDVVKIPFEKEKSSDENKQVPNLPILFNSLCPYFRYDIVSRANADTDAKIIMEYDQICTEIANTISAIASFGIQDIKDQEASLEDKMMYGSETSPMQRLYQKGNRNLRGLAQSEIPETLVNVLASNQKSKDTIVAVIEAISNTSLYLPNAEKFSQMGVLKDLVRIISEAPDFRSYIVHISIEAIWNLIEVEGQKAIETMASQQEVVLALRQPFERVLKEGYKLDDKCLRNEICILINYVVTCIASHQFFLERETPQDSTFLEAILHYATHDELNGKGSSSGEGTVGRSVKPLFTTRDEDVEFKKLLWTCILYLVRDPDNVEAHQCVIDKQFMSALLMYIDPNNQNVSSHRWQPPQLKEIQVHGLSVIANILPLLPEHFHSINGHVILIQFLSAYNDYERRIACMKALLNTSTYDYFKKDFADKGIVDILLDIVQNAKENPLDMREMAFNIISNISKDCRPNQKEFRRKSGIEILKENLAYSEVDQTGNASTFLLAVLDCLNNAVFGNKRCELHFLDIEGVYVLLDLVESCEPALKRLTLSSLCTILENNKSFQYFVEWNSSKTTINATQLLIKLYEEEDQRYSVTYSNGILENVERPLHPKESYLVKKYGNEQNKDPMNITQSKHSQTNDSVVFKDNGMNVSARHGSRFSEHSQKTQRSVITNNPEKPINLSTSSKAAKGLKQALEAAGKMNNKIFSESYLNKIMMDVARSYDIRATIFGTFYRVGFDLHELSPQEKQRMEIIQLYPYLKNGELWRDIKEELADQNIKPTSDDKHWMETCIEESQEQTEGAVHNQSLYAQDIKMKDQEELDNYFSAIRLKNQINAKGMGQSKK